MKLKLALYFIPILFIAILIEGCNNSDYDRDLRGKWQLSASNISNCGIDSVFMSFDNNIFFLQRVFNERTAIQYTGKFTQRNDSLILEFVDDFAVDTVGLVGYFKWDNKLRHDFKIVSLTGSKLQLKDATKEFSFRKY